MISYCSPIVLNGGQTPGSSVCLFVASMWRGSLFLSVRGGLPLGQVNRPPGITLPFFGFYVHPRFFFFFEVARPKHEFRLCCIHLIGFPPQPWNLLLLVLPPGAQFNLCQFLLGRRAPHASGNRRPSFQLGFLVLLSFLRTPCRKKNGGHWFPQVPKKTTPLLLTPDKSSLTACNPFLQAAIDFRCV